MKIRNFLKMGGKWFKRSIEESDESSFNPGIRSIPGAVEAGDGRFNEIEQEMLGNRRDPEESARNEAGQKKTKPIIPKEAKVSNGG